MGNFVDPKAIFSSGQVEDTGIIIKMLKQHGMTVRRSNGGNHYVYFHPAHPDLEDTIADTNPDIRGQKQAAKYCIELENREKEAAALAKAKPNRASSSFKKVSTSRAKLPEDMDLKEGRHVIGSFMRLKKYPQIATQISLAAGQNHIDERADYLRRRGRQLQTRLDHCVNDLEFVQDSSQRGGRIKLTHPAYGISVILEPFTSRHQNFTCLSELDKYIRLIEQADKAHALQLRDFESDDEIMTRPAEVDEAPEKSRIVFDFRNHLSGEVSELVLPISPRGRYSEESYMSFLDQLFAKRFENLKKNLKTYVGIDIHRTKGGKMEGRHTVYDDVKFTISDYTALPTYLETFRDFIGQEGADTEIESAEANALVKDWQGHIQELTEEKMTAHKEIRKAVEKVIETQKGLYPKFQMVMEQIRSVGRTSVQSKPSMGTPFVVEVAIGKKHTSFTGVHVIDAKTGNIAEFISRSDLESLQSFADRAIPRDLTFMAGAFNSFRNGPRRFPNLDHHSGNAVGPFDRGPSLAELAAKHS